MNGNTGKKTGKNGGKKKTVEDTPPALAHNETSEEKRAVAVDVNGKKIRSKDHNSKKAPSREKEDTLQTSGTAGEKRIANPPGYLRRTRPRWKRERT